MNVPPPPIFIVGAPRSGTTWLLSMLEHHPQCRALTTEMLGITTSRPTKETGIFLRGFSADELTERFARLPSDRVLVEKTPGHLLQAGRIKRLFPDARIVLVRRNAQDVIWSMIQENTFWEDSPKSLVDAAGLYNGYASAENAYYGYDAVVDYETLWERPLEVLARLLDELGLDPGPAAGIVEQTREGKALPHELSGVFRKGSPGEGDAHFTAVDRAFIDSNLRRTSRPVRPLSILLATNHLFGWTGSETLLLTLIDGLLQAGCRIAVYVRHWNPEWVDAHFDPRVRLTDDIRTLGAIHFDLAHVQHSACLVDVRAARPVLPILFSSLGVLPFLEQPVPFELGVSRYLAISEEVAANLTAHGIDERRIHIFRNLVSDSRFRLNTPIRQRPERILVLSYKMDAARREALRMAAERIGASIRFVGKLGEPIMQDRLASVIDEADVVVSLGRGVVEAMLCGRVPLVYDIHGGDGLVTPDTLEDIRKNNFSGRRHGREYAVEDLVTEFSKYRQEFGAQLRELALDQFGTQRNLPRLLEIYETILAEPAPDPLPVETMRILEFCSALAHEETQLDKQRQEAEQRLLAEIQRMRRTVSWRITAPLRVFWNAWLKITGKSWSKYVRHRR